MGIFDDLDNPLPDAPASDSKPASQARLPLRAELLVDDRKYAGERVDREDAEIAEVDSDDEEPGEFDHVLFDNSDSDDGGNDIEDIGREDEESEEDQGDPRSKGYGKVSQVNEQYLMDETGNGIASDLKELEAREEEKKFAERLAEERSKEIKKAKAIHAQKAAYDSVVDFRIRVEQVLTVARGFPTCAQREESADWKSLDISDTENMELVKVAEASLDELIESTRSALIKMCPSNIDATSEESFCKWQDAVLDKWGKKVDESEGVVPKGGFKAIDSSASGQLRATLTTGKHVQRAQRVRVAVPLHGNAGEIHVGTSDIHYEDKELYRSLLQEVIESGEGTGGGLRYARLTKSGKVKKKIDRRASKARKLRYIVHEKLVGFLAPLPLPPPGPIDEIIASIFGGANKVSLLQSR